MVHNVGYYINNICSTESKCGNDQTYLQQDHAINDVNQTLF